MFCIKMLLFVYFLLINVPKYTWVTSSNTATGGPPAGPPQRYRELTQSLTGFPGSELTFALRNVRGDLKLVNWMQLDVSDMIFLEEKKSLTIK